jgi:hypothetical protein
VKGESICDDNHVVGFVHVFEDLEFEVEGGVEIK